MAERYFWNSKNMEPKRNHKFQISFGGDIVHWIVKDFQRPSYEVNEAEHNYLNHKFYYPGIVSWNPVDFTLVDPIDQNAVEILKEIIFDSGYTWIDPQAAGENAPDPNNLKTISKRKSVEALGEVKIQHIDAEGSVVDEWILHNAWVQNVEYSDLSYENDDLSDITITLRYDYATSQQKLLQF